MSALKNQNILIISPEAWGASFVSKHHYACELAKDNKVYFLNPPSSIKGIDVIEHPEYRNLLIVDYEVPFRGLRYLPKWLRVVLTKRWIRKLESKLNNNLSIVWNFDSSRFFDLDAFVNCQFRIFHLVDLNQDFEWEKAAKSANVCFCTTDFIVEKLRFANEKSFKVNHGYNFKETLTSALSQRIENDTRIKVVYVGNLNIRYLDWFTILDVCSQHKDLSFYFIGPEGKSNLSNYSSIHEATIAKIKSMSHVHFTGMVDANLIPGILEKADLLMLCYLADEFPEQLANPHKMMEYLGSGRSIVATFTYEYRSHKNLIQMSDKNAAFSKLFDETVHKIEQFNSIKLGEERKKVAMDHSYPNQIEKIAKILSDINIE